MALISLHDPNSSHGSEGASDDAGSPRLYKHHSKAFEAFVVFAICSGTYTVITWLIMSIVLEVM
jgi:hypothetical protein